MLPFLLKKKKQGTGVELPEGSKTVAFRAKSTDVRQNTWKGVQKYVVIIFFVYLSFANIPF
jgi:hypothetical protein